MYCQLVLAQAVSAISAAVVLSCKIFILFLWVGLNGCKFYCKNWFEDSSVNILSCVSSSWSSIFTFLIGNILPLKALGTFSLPSKSNPEFLKKPISSQVFFTFFNSVANILCSKSVFCSVIFPLYTFLNSTTSKEYVSQF